MILQLYKSVKFLYTYYWKKAMQHSVSQRIATYGTADVG